MTRRFPICDGKEVSYSKISLWLLIHFIIHILKETSFVCLFAWFAHFRGGTSNIPCIGYYLFQYSLLSIFISQILKQDFIQPMKKKKIEVKRQSFTDVLKFCFFVEFVFRERTKSQLFFVFFLILCDYSVGRSMTLDSRSPWTNPQKNKCWEETLLYYSQTKFYWWLHKVRISPCVSALQTNLRMYFKPWSLQKERRACLLSLFHPGLQIFLWHCVCLAACLPLRSAKYIPLPQWLQQSFSFLSHFFP